MFEELLVLKVQTLKTKNAKKIIIRYNNGGESAESMCKRFVGTTYNESAVSPKPC